MSGSDFGPRICFRIALLGCVFGWVSAGSASGGPFSACTNTVDPVYEIGSVACASKFGIVALVATIVAIA